MQNTAPLKNELAIREYRTLKRLVLVALAVSCAVSLSMNLADPDLWGHVRYGEDLLAEGSLPETATHTFTARDHRWINHENLAEITFALVYRYGGDEGLLIFKCIWGMLVLALMAWAARRNGVPPLAIGAVLLLIASNLTAFFPVRPQLLSYMCLAGVLVLLELAFTGWHGWLEDARRPARPPRQLWWLAGIPLVVIVWTNSHGAFVAGVAIIGAYLAGRIVEAVIYRRDRSLSVVAVLAGVGIATLLATLVNPYGYELHQWLMMSLGAPRPEITEWDPPKLTDPVFVPLMLLVATSVASFALTRLRRDWVQISLLVLLLWQACEHVRHISLLSILAGFWLPPHFHSVARRLRPNTNNMPVIELGGIVRWTLAAGLCVAIALQASVLYFRTAKLPVFRNMYPVDAIAYMAEREMEGRLVVSFNWAQYALAALAPKVEVSFDGRFRTCYPQEVIDRNFDFLLGEHGGRRYRSPNSGPVDGSQVLADGAPNLVLVDRSYKHAMDVMAQAAEQDSPQWTLVYQDSVAQLWGLSSEFDDPTHENYVPVAERLISDHRSDTAVAWPALPPRAQHGRIATGRQLEPTQDPQM